MRLSPGHKRLQLPAWIPLRMHWSPCLTGGHSYHRYGETAIAQARLDVQSASRMTVAWSDPFL